MDGMSSPDPMTRRFDSGILRLALWLVSLWRGTLTACCPLLTLLIDRKSSPDPRTQRFDSGMLILVLWLVILRRGTPTAPSMCGTHLITQYMSIFMHSQTPWVGSLTQQVAYYIGYPQNAVKVCIHLLS